MSVTSTARSLSSRGAKSDSPRRPRGRRGGVGLKAIVAVCLAGAGWVTYGGFNATTPTDAYRGALTAPVHRGNLLITVIEDGNLESSKNLEIKCQVPGALTILEIVTDGSEVHQGDLLVRLDSSLLEDAILSQEIVQGKAEAAKISAEKSFAAASIAVDEYREGTFVQQLEELQVAATVAKQNVASMENLLFYSKKMHRSGYVTQLDVESKEFAVEQARLNLGVAELKKDVLEKFTRAKMLEDLTSKRDSAQALMKSQQATEQQESNKLRRLAENLDKCIIRAPQDGMVVYANDMTGGRRGSTQEAPKVELGAQVRQYQSLLRIPDLKHIRVKTLVHESKVDQLRVGQRAQIKVLDREFQGEVISIANQPEAANRMSNGVKEYATVVAIDGEPVGLKPGMTADVEILVEEKQDVLAVPLQCVVETRKKRRAWVKTPVGVEMRELLLGATDDVSVEVLDGLKEGELVLLNPMAVIGAAETAEQEEEESAAAQPSGPRDAAASSPGGSPDGNRGPRQDRDGAGTRPEGAGRTDTAGAGRPDGAWGASREAGAGPERRGPPGGGRRRLNFKELDKNGDGKVSLDEMPEDRRERFGRMDANGDGFIDQGEQKAIEERMRQAQEQGGWGGGPPGGQ
ncbi:MAG TPA: HlyD family efflux transporter periplasmic adaptor subunit [Pirellulales bacterium]|jgi:multidrug resistance efflux pump|nr:HlyD family efflux transporter periplasmic adaptor subunit [Pirellulales bacterium]